MSNRSTGKSIRWKLLALHGLLSGKNVLFVNDTVAVAENMCWQSRELLEATSINMDEVQCTRDTIKFHDCTLRFVSKSFVMSPANRGFKSDITIDDVNFWGE